MSIKVLSTECDDIALALAGGIPYTHNDNVLDPALGRQKFTGGQHAGRV